MTRLFLLPIILSLLWIAFLRFNRVPLSKGKTGFIYIIAISAAVTLVFTLLMWLTRH